MGAEKEAIHLKPRPRLAPHPDAQNLAYWLGQVALRDERAFEALYQATSAHLLGVAMLVMRRRERAEEVLQEAFVNVWHGAAKYAQTDASPMSWLISIVRHKGLDHLRANKHYDSQTSLEADDGAAADTLVAEDIDPLALLTLASVQHSVRACLDGLDAPLRQSLALAYYEGLSHGQVSNRLQVPLGTVKGWLRRGADKLRDCLRAHAT